MDLIAESREIVHRTKFQNKIFIKLKLKMYFAKRCNR